MVLDKYISDLLYRYDCVIIPGFGGFIANKASANNIVSQHKFIPPTKEIVFNKHLDNNDGLLANYLVKAKKISYNHAIELIEKNVVAWNEEMELDKTFEIKRVGSFRLSDDRTLEFTADTSVNYLTESYGLATFTSLSIPRKNNSSKVKKIALNDDVRKNNSLRNIVRYAAIIVPFITISTLSYYQLNDSDVFLNNANIGINPANKIEVVSPKEKNIKVEEKNIEIPVSTNILPITEKKVIFKYHVISGAFGQRSNAQKNMENLNSRGIEARLLGKNKHGLFMVAYKSFENIREAKIYLNDVKVTDNSKAWIWKKSL